MQSEEIQQWTRKPEREGGGGKKLCTKLYCVLALLLRLWWNRGNFENAAGVSEGYSKDERLK